MRNLVVIKTLIVIILAVRCIEASARVFYVSQDGNDNTGNGSAAAPWRSLYKACECVKTAGDTIFVRVGIFDEKTTSKLAAGVNIVGEGINSVITSTTLTSEWTPIIDMRSPSFTNGNQTISNLNFDGSSLKAAQALWIAKRNNVGIHHCTFKDFKYTGITWVGDGGNSGSDPYDKPVYPANYVTGSVFHDNTVTNCAINEPYGWGRGALFIGGHDGMLLYNNKIIQTQRADGYNGYPIKAFANGGFMKGWKVYNNTIIKKDHGTGSWPFAVEGAFYEGCEFYNNIITGAIDINFIDRGNYDYGVYIHDNTLGPDTISSYHYTGIILEFGVEDVIIERNNFRNCAVGIYHTMRYPEPWVRRVKVRYNKFSNLGYKTYHSAIRFGETQFDFDIQDYEICNNLFHGNPSERPYFGIHMRGFRKAENIRIQNNIFMNFSWSWFESNRGSYFDTLIIQNNILYNNGKSNSATLNGVPDNYINSGNIISNPDLSTESNFHPKSNSKAIKAGIYIPGMTVDLDSIPVGNPPNIGCYETVEDTMQSGAGKFLLIGAAGLLLFYFITRLLITK
jgi:hypothetical protein